MSGRTKLYTIGFTKKGAREFFGLLKAHGIRRLVDIRLNNRSQLAGFTKRDDLEYFAGVLCDASYHHMPTLAPTQAILDRLKKHKGSWAEYETHFQGLMRERSAIEHLDCAFFDEPCCLLCSEAIPEHCHRRLVADGIQKRWPELEIVHL